MTPEGHRERAREHEKVGRVLAETGHEWAAVCLFYSAYHQLKAALLEDPVFDRHDLCQRINPDLLPDDRYTDKHKGRRGRPGIKEWGLNDLVLLLYRSAAATYEKLHQASIDVRYQSGLKTTPAEILGLFEQFEHLRSTGALTSTVVLEDGPD